VGPGQLGHMRWVFTSLFVECLWIWVFGSRLIDRYGDGHDHGTAISVVVWWPRSRHGTESDGGVMMRKHCGADIDIVDCRLGTRDKISDLFPPLVTGTLTSADPL